MLRMRRQSIRALWWSATLAVLTTLLLAGCGGGGGDGFTQSNLRFDDLSTNVTVDNLPLRLSGEPVNATSPFVSRVTVRVIDGAGLPVSGATINASVSGPATVSALTEGATSGTLALTTQTDGSGIATLFVIAGDRPGSARLSVRASRPGAASGAADRSFVFTIGRPGAIPGPVSALSFTGPFIDAIVAGRKQFDLVPGESTDFQNGTYSRLITVRAVDADGNPVEVGTAIRLKLIDSPLVGFPENGSGAFSITGVADPEENGRLLRTPVSTGETGFITRGARVGDRVVLDPEPRSSDFFHAGIRTISRLDANRPRELEISPNEPPFRNGEDTGFRVPYVVGRAQVGSVPPLAFTDAQGNASFLLTYPFSSLGRTAILVAHTEDFSVSAVFNPGGPVYLGEQGENASLSVSPTILPARVQNGEVTACVRDENSVPVSNAAVAFALAEANPATVDVNGQGANGAVRTGANGCATLRVSVRGQLPGEDAINLSLSSFGKTVEVTILGIGEGTLVGNLNCGAGTFDLAYIDDRGNPIEGAALFVNNIAFSVQDYAPNFRFDSSGGGLSGRTDDQGRDRLNFDPLPQPEVGEPDNTLDATVTAANNSVTLSCSRAAPPPGP